MRCRIVSALVLLVLTAAAPAWQPTPPPSDAGDLPRVTTGVQGVCLLQFIPGVEGAAIPPPTPYAGATVRLLTPDEKRVVAEGKSVGGGLFRFAAPPGKYHLVAEPPPGSGITGARGAEVEILTDRVTEAKLMLFLLGV
jgi:hypothetical protein